MLFNRQKPQLGVSQKTRTKMPPKVAAKVSAKAAAAADEGPQATAADVHLIYAVNKNTDKPDINWAGVAADCGLKNADSAKVGRFYFNLTPSSGPHGSSF